MTNATPKGVALPFDLDDAAESTRATPSSISKLASSKDSAQGFRTYSQREIEHECWIMLGEIDDARRYRERIAANRRRP